MTKKYEVEIGYIEGWGGDTSPDERKPGGIIIGWQTKDMGYGTLTIYEKNGRFECDTEAMSPEFVDAVFAALRKNLVLDAKFDPEIS
jgi:hypothetical protein